MNQSTINLSNDFMYINVFLTIIYKMMHFGDLVAINLFSLSFNISGAAMSKKENSGSRILLLKKNQIIVTNK